MRRIGVRAWTSNLLRVRAGETIIQNVVLDPFTSLPRVTVVDRSFCTSGRDGPRVAALWREAETALTTIAVSTRDSTLRRQMVRFTRKLGLPSSEILEESYHSYDENDGIGEPAFRSLLDDLSAAVEPPWMQVVGDFNVRGGIKSVVTASIGQRPSWFTFIVPAR